MIIKIDPSSDEPLYRQLRTQIIIGLATGQLELGEQLPSVRQLADELGMNMMTVSKAYSALKDEGYLITDRRTGTKVAEEIPQNLPKEDYLKELTLFLADFYNRGGSEKEALSLVNEVFATFKKDVRK